MRLTTATAHSVGEVHYATELGSARLVVTPDGRLAYPTGYTVRGEFELTERPFGPSFYARGVYIPADDEDAYTAAALVLATRLHEALHMLSPTAYIAIHPQLRAALPLLSIPAPNQD